MKKRTERQKLIKECDELFSKIVKSKVYCERCGKTTTLQAAHIVSRKALGIRWNFDNAFCLCWNCHFHFAHKEPLVEGDKDFRTKRGAINNFKRFAKLNNITNYKIKSG